MVQAVKSNFCQREIAAASFELQQRIDAGERIVGDVNRYEHADEEPIPILRIDTALERKQLNRVRVVRGRRDGQAVAQAPVGLKSRPRRAPRRTWSHDRPARRRLGRRAG